KENDVASCSASALQYSFNYILRHELDDRRLQTFHASCQVVDLDPGQTFCTIDANKLGVLVDCAAGQGSTARYTQCDYAAARIVGRTGEDFKVDFFHQVSDVGELKIVTQIRFVGTKTTHCLGPGHAREFAQIHTQVLLENSADHAFSNTHDAFFIHKGCLDIDLGKFRLTVSTQVFVTEALGDLIITVDASHHQNLFEQLW